MDITDAYEKRMGAPLREYRGNYIGLCPFHKESTPSFLVNSGRGVFLCFGCGESGLVEDFERRLQRKPPMTVKDYLQLKKGK
jgi:DNA primase